jgi:hypothetical protein
MHCVLQILHAVDPEKLVGVFAALLTPTIAGIAVYIAWQQHKINRGQFRLALLERRFRVFDATGELIATVLRQGRVSAEDLQKFLWETRDNEFLFGADIKAHLDEVYKQASSVYALEGAGPNAAERVAALKWFVGQYEEVKQKFAKYMTFRDDF